jgi:polyisoprenoid-binding protein YceI
MKRRFFPLLFTTVVIILLGFNTGYAGQIPDRTSTSYIIDRVHSHVTFSVAHLYALHVIGTVPIIAGTISIPTDTDIPTTISATLDARHIDTHDADRNDSLQGPDWFDTEHFPTWSFTSTSITPGNEGTFTVNGSLRIHGVAQPVTLNVTRADKMAKLTYHATTRVDRHAFGMRLTPLDGTIGNIVEIALDIVL